MYERVSQRPPARAAVALVAAAAVCAGTYKAYATMADTSAPTRTIADYRRIGELTDHTTRAIVVNPSLAHPVMYWGWIVGQEWDLGEPVLPSWIDPSEKDYLIVVGNDALQDSPGLGEFASGRPVVERTDRFTVFALRERAAARP
jgi:hypothetical protein